MKYSTLILACALTALSGAALADQDDHGSHGDHQKGSQRHHRDPPHATETGGNAMQAPEIDPSSAIAGLTLLSGGLVVLRSRYRKG